MRYIMLLLVVSVAYAVLTVSTSIPTALEMPAVLSALAGHARTVPGSKALRTARLAPTAAAAREQYSLVAEAMALQPDELPPLGHSLDLEPVLIALQDKEVLDVPTLAEVARAVEALAELAQWSECALDVRQSCPRLATLSASAAPPARLAAKLGGEPRPFVELPSGGVSMSSEAFPILHGRRAAVRAAQKAITEEMARLMADKKFKGQLAEPDAQATTRDGRLVVPVQPQEKRTVGVEVARSRRGATVYVEPHSLTGPSATLRAAEASLAATEARLLLGMSLLLRRELVDLLAAVDAAATLDGMVARATLGRLWDGVVPSVGEEGVIDLPDARHPLLVLKGLPRRASGEGDAPAEEEPPATGAIGNSLSLGASASAAADDAATTARPQALLLTGPNGGGKSVVLKTVALSKAFEPSTASHTSLPLTSHRPSIRSPCRPCCAGSGCRCRARPRRPAAALRAATSSRLCSLTWTTRRWGGGERTRRV